jgi:hypothetical protein
VPLNSNGRTAFRIRPKSDVWDSALDTLPAAEAACEHLLNQIIALRRDGFLI